MEPTNEIRPRQIKDAPFCWQHKETLQMIRDVFENGHGITAIPISIYVALTELASDAQSETFTAPISEIARRASVSYRTAFSFLKRFEDVKLIAVSRSIVPGTKERTPSTYTMLCTPCITLCKREASSFAENEEKNLKNLKKHSLKRDTPFRSAKMRDSSDLSEYSEAQRQLIDIYHAKLCDTERGWLPVTQYADSVVKALEMWVADPKIFAELCDDAANGINIPPGSKTLVRLIWNNY
jgi:hypothetical protein